AEETRNTGAKLTRDERLGTPDCTYTKSAAPASAGVSSHRSPRRGTRSRIRVDLSPPRWNEPGFAAVAGGGPAIFARSAGPTGRGLPFEPGARGARRYSAAWLSKHPRFVAQRRRAAAKGFGRKQLSPSEETRQRPRSVALRPFAI